jgi:hypothetical protein
MSSLAGRAIASTAGLFVAMALILFVPPWTLDWWQAWLFLAVYFGGAIALMLDLLKRDPALLERRMKAGPWAEERLAQKVIMLVASAGFIALQLIPAFDRRYGWSACRPRLPCSATRSCWPAATACGASSARTASPRRGSNSRRTSA